MAHTILFNSSTGSNTLASGAGPGTALTGTSASYSGSVFTLDGSPNLSAIVAGTDVLWVATSTGRQFFDITSVNDGADTVTVVSAPAGTSTGLSWAIGGKRATFDGSRQLFADAKGGWTIEAEDDGSMTLATTAVTVSAAGTSTTGKVLIRGASGAKRVCNQTSNVANFTVSGGHVMFRNIKFTNSAGSKTSTRAITYSTGSWTICDDCIIGDATNQLLNGFVCGNSAAGIRLFNCEVTGCTGDGFSSGASSPQFIDLQYCNIHDNGGHGVSWAAGQAESVLRALGCIFDTNAGDGINLAAASNIYHMIINGCTFYNNVDGIEASPQWGMESIIINSNFANNSGTGLKFLTSNVDPWIQTANYNNFYSNGADRQNITAGANDQALDPQFVNAAAGDFRIGTNLKALGWPGTLPG